MASALQPAGDEARRSAEDTGRHIRAIEEVLAEALSRHPHDTVRLLQAIGAALLQAQSARHLNEESKAIIEYWRRRNKATGGP